MSSGSGGQAAAAGCPGDIVPWDGPMGRWRGGTRSQDDRTNDRTLALASP